MRIGKARHINIRLENGPFGGGVIKMSLGQTETLVFRVNGSGYGSYKRHTFGKHASWELEEDRKK